MEPETLSASFGVNARALRRILRIDRCFDVIEKELLVGGRDGAIFYIDGFAKDDVFEKILEFCR